MYVPRYKRITNFKCTFLYQNRSSNAFSLIKLRFNYNAFGLTVRVGFQFKKVCLEKNFFKQKVHIHAGLCRYLNTLILASPILNKDIAVCKLLSYSFQIYTRFINFIYSYNNRHIGCLGVVNSFNCLRHYCIISCNNKYHNICNLCTSCAHSGKCFVPRCIEKGNLLSAFEHYFISTYVLCNAPRFSRYYVCIADIIENGGLAVIYVPHNCNNRRPWKKIFHFIGVAFFSINIVFFLEFDIVAEFIRYKRNCFNIKALVN